MKSCACAMRAAFSISSSVASGAPNAMFSRTVVEKRNGSWATIAIERRSSPIRRSRTSTPSSRTAPS